MGSYSHSRTCGMVERKVDINKRVVCSVPSPIPDSSYLSFILRFDRSSDI